MILVSFCSCICLVHHTPTNHALNPNSLTSGAFLLTFGKLADMFGRKILFIIGMGGFTISLLIAGFATGCRCSRWLENGIRPCSVYCGLVPARGVSVLAVRCYKSSHASLGLARS